VLGAVRDSRPFSTLAKIPPLGGELAGVVTADDAELEEPDWRRVNGSLMLGSKKLGKIGLVAEIPLSRTISVVVIVTPL
jgi:hypothetical protein